MDNLTRMDMDLTITKTKGQAQRLPIQINNLLTNQKPSNRTDEQVERLID